MKLTLSITSGIERALREELGAADLVRLVLEHVDEGLADELALGLRVGEPGEAVHEQRLGVHMDQRDVVGIAEQADDLLGFALPHQPVVDEHAGELLADRLMDQHRGDGAVDAARQAADDATLADLGADFLDLGLAEFGHRPIAGAAADVAHEIGDQLGAVGGVRDLEVELGAVDSAAPRRRSPRTARRR